jgi:hypothetical protein
MLNKARATHPDIEYLESDMRTLRLNRQFDAVVIPDSIDYMVTLADLQQAIRTAVDHLKMGGVLLVVGKIMEAFQNNNFAYFGEKNGVHVTLLENNYIHSLRPNTYEVTLVYLIRQQGELTIHIDRHTLGLFSQATWDKVFSDSGLAMRRVPLDHIYDKYLLGDGEYPMMVFVGQKIL